MARRRRRYRRNDAGTDVELGIGVLGLAVLGFIVYEVVSHLPSSGGGSGDGTGITAMSNLGADFESGYAEGQQIGNDIDQAFTDNLVTPVKNFFSTLFSGGSSDDTSGDGSQ